MKLANVRDEDLEKVAMLKNKKNGCATSEARRAQQILYTRNKSKGFHANITHVITSHLDVTAPGNYQTFEEANGCTLEEYLEKKDG